MRGLASVLALLVVFSAGCDGDPSPSSSPSSSAPSPPSASPRPTYAPAEIVGRVQEPRLVETSGLVASRTSARVLWAHNDSGGAPEIFCLDLRGRSCGTVALEGAEAFDWEDIAARDGELFVGDIGDNIEQRTSISIYRVTEPAAGATSIVAERIEFTYPRRAHDAEALLVHPRSGRIYVITKDSPAIVFRGTVGGGELKPVGALRLPGLLSFVTAADITPDGKRVVVATYDSAFELVSRGGSFDRIWRRTPREIQLPLARQREAIAYGRNGDSIITTSEGEHPPLIERVLVGG